MKQKIFRIATRQSMLALWQANHIKKCLTALHPQLQIELLGITTSGDKNLTGPLSNIGGKALFVKELEQALLEGRADIAVHSMKDVPMDFPEGLALTAICKREDPRDAFLATKFPNLAALPAGAVIGTASLRRLCQLRALRPDLVVQPLRGNIDTRLQRLESGLFDAIILAAAGLHRLGFTNRITEYLPLTQFLPAAGQGALAIESRENDAATLALIKPLNDLTTQLCIQAERALNQQLDGGCQVPIAAYATLEQQQLQLQGMVGSLDGKTILYATESGPSNTAEQLGKQVAQQLLAQGAYAILQQIKTQENGFGAK